MEGSPTLVYCNCKIDGQAVEAKAAVSHSEKNPNRPFYACPTRKEEGGCGFFSFADQLPRSGDNRSSMDFGKKRKFEPLKVESPTNQSINANDAPRSKEAECAMFLMLNRLEQLEKDVQAKSDVLKDMYDRVGAVQDKLEVLFNYLIHNKPL